MHATSRPCPVLAFHGRIVLLWYFAFFPLAYLLVLHLNLMTLVTTSFSNVSFSSRMVPFLCSSFLELLSYSRAFIPPHRVGSRFITVLEGPAVVFIGDLGTTDITAMWNCPHHFLRPFLFSFNRAIELFFFLSKDPVHFYWNNTRYCCCFSKLYIHIYIIL